MLQSAMFRNNFQAAAEAAPGGGTATTKATSRLQAVFSKLSGMVPRAEDLATPKTMSSDIIESVLTDSPLPPQTSWNDPYVILAEEADCVTTIAALSQRLEAELRSSKRTHLACGEVLLPCGLLQRISRDILSMAESEPCGLRGCKLYLLFEASNADHCATVGRLSSFHCDPTTTATFELYLTLKQSATGWNFWPQFLRNLTRGGTGGGTIVVSPAYILSKKKLYRSFAE